ncbi:MAG TPA: hypothetical protein VFT59_03755 [Candidatus Saccharimonadales bacterium]|nr:hypothetical protein [Candidatus Saccharimonadales bacterium]
MTKSVRQAALEAAVLKNDGWPIGYAPPSKLNTMGWVLTWTLVIAVYSWFVLGASGGITPDYLEHPLVDSFTDPLPNFIAWIGGY